MAIDVQTHLADAQAEAHRLAVHLTGLEARLADGADQDPDLAQQVEEARSAWVLAEATARAVQEILAQVAEERAAQEAAEAEGRRREHLRVTADQDDRQYRAAEADMHRHLADVEPGLAAVRESLAAALECQRAAREAEWRSYQARVGLGEQPPGRQIYGPDAASTRIRSFTVLRAIYEGRWDEM